VGVLEENLGLLGDTDSSPGSFDMSVVMGPTWRQAIEKREGSSASP